MTSDVNSRHELFYLLLIGLAPLELNGFYNRYLFHYPFFYWMVELITWILIPSVIYFVGIKKHYFSNHDLGFHFQIFGKQSLLAFIVCQIIAFIFMPYLNSLSNYYSRIIFPTNWGKIPFDYRNVIPSGGVGKVLVLAYMAITAGIVEELYFRSIFRLLFNNSLRGIISYIFISSLIFSSAHWEGGITALLSTFLFGFVFSVIYVSIKNVWPLILGHACTDFLWFS